MSMHDAPSGGERATLALVSEQIRSLRDLVRAEFKDTQRQLDALNTLPVTVASLTERMLQSEVRITDLEKTAESKRQWRVVSLPAILIGIIGLLLTVIGLLVAAF